MARKSRKQTKQYETPLLLCSKSSFIQVAAYIRLSVEDMHHKGDSIETQKRIILNYINENPDFELYDTYIDTGVSGTTFDRAEFQRMLHDAETGKINCIIVKDLSRLGRNVIDTDYYAEVIFPKLYMRLISINDGYDSANAQDNFSMLLINLVNEAYGHLKFVYGSGDRELCQLSNVKSIIGFDDILINARKQIIENGA